MKRIPRAATIGIGAVLVMAFFFLVPVFPMRPVTWDLYAQHNWCYGSLITSGPPPTTLILAAPSYALSGHGEVYVVSGGFLWWLPAPNPSGGLVCI